MRGYTTRDVESLVGLTVRQAQEYGRSGVLDPDRTSDNRYLFSFQDLVLLRTARALLEADVPQRRVLRALRRLKDQLPSGRSLTEVRIAAEGDEVVAYDGATAWSPESGQMRLVFDVAELAERVRPFAREAVDGGEHTDAAEWVELGIELETPAPAQARRAYEKALALEPDNRDALVNLGRLLIELDESDAAVKLFLRAMELSGGDDAVAAFNLGTALEDRGQRSEAIHAYEQAVSADPAFADAHYNLSRLYEDAGDKLSALRHLKAYRALGAR